MRHRAYPGVGVLAGLCDPTELRRSFDLGTGCSVARKVRIRHNKPSPSHAVPASLAGFTLASRTGANARPAVDRNASQLANIVKILDDLRFLDDLS